MGGGNGRGPSSGVSGRFACREGDKPKLGLGIRGDDTFEFSWVPFKLSKAA